MFRNLQVFNISPYEFCCSFFFFFFLKGQFIRVRPEDELTPEQAHAQVWTWGKKSFFFYFYSFFLFLFFLLFALIET